MERRAWAHRGPARRRPGVLTRRSASCAGSNAEVLAAAEQLKPVTIETLLARSDLAESLRIRHEFQRERVLYRWSCSPTDPVTKLSQSHRNLAIDMDSHRKFS